ncbi:hypothetical protein [Paenibacillus apis]|uniref:hypothetical protein n=1 Tax=Paenibacillus apis TaxID=1792174 RepID=UPI00265B393D|nr:hypothetical protein [Paenibacillus apis]
MSASSRFFRFAEETAFYYGLHRLRAFTLENPFIQSAIGLLLQEKDLVSNGNKDVLYENNASAIIKSAHTRERRR